jgi:hypothetical protein
MSVVLFKIDLLRFSYETCQAAFADTVKIAAFFLTKSWTLCGLVPLA